MRAKWWGNQGCIEALVRIGAMSAIMKYLISMRKKPKTCAVKKRSPNAVPNLW